MPLFGPSKKNPAEIVKATRDALTVLEQEATSSKKTEKVVCMCNQMVTRKAREIIRLWTKRA